jgi:hypothetical protein
MKQGDVILQKGTNHAWKNPHPTEWTRIYAVLTNSVPVSIAGVGGAEDKVRMIWAMDGELMVIFGRF